MIHKFTKDDIQFLKENKDKLSNKEIAEKLHLNKPAQVTWALRRYNLKRIRGKKEQDSIKKNHKSNNYKSYVSGNKTSKYTTCKGKQLQIININLIRNPNLLRRIELCVEGTNRNGFYSNDERLRYIFDNFFVWLRTGEYVFYHKQKLYRTGYFSGEFAMNGGKGKEKLSKWKDNFLKEIRI